MGGNYNICESFDLLMKYIHELYRFVKTINASYKTDLQNQKAYLV